MAILELLRIDTQRENIRGKEGEGYGTCTEQNVDRRVAFQN